MRIGQCTNSAFRISTVVPWPRSRMPRHTSTPRPFYLDLNIMKIVSNTAPTMGQRRRVFLTKFDIAIRFYNRRIDRR